MSDPKLERVFPKLRASGYRETSPPEPKYNCIAWAAGENHRWWQPVMPVNGYYWPPDSPLEHSTASYVQAFELQGYQLCDNPDLEEGFEKVALYVDANMRPTHAARQLESGAWTSKLGKGKDIEHSTLEALEDSEYGSVLQVLKRPRKID